MTIPSLDDLPEETPPPPPVAVMPPATSERRNLLPAVVMVGVTVAAAGMGVGLFLLSQQEESSRETQASTIRGRFHSCVQSAPNYDGPDSCDKLHTTAVRAESFRNVAIGAFIGTGVAAVGAAAYLLWPTPKHTSGTNVRAIPMAGAHEGGLLISGSF